MSRRARNILVTVLALAAAGLVVRGLTLALRDPRGLDAVHNLSVKADGAPFDCPGCNVILISVDTLRADHLGFHGYHRNTSPALDAMAEQSVVFENAIAQSSWTTPSHASMFTGLDPSAHGLIYYKNPGRLARKLPTIAELLARAGYRTGGFHGGGYVSPKFGLGRGFETYKSSSRFFDESIPAALEWIGKDSPKPFFAFVHGYDTHRPYIHSERNSWVDPVPGYDIKEFCTTPESRRIDSRTIDYVVAQYDAGISHVDALLGGFLEELERLDLVDKTLIIVTSDHGDEFFEHGNCDHMHSVFEELVHVPLLLRFPSGIPARVKTRVAASSSLLPTILSITGARDRIAGYAPSDGDARARDLRALLESARRESTEPIVSESGRRLGETHYWKGVSSRSEKLIWSSIRGDAQLQYYDLDEDPGEQNDLAQESPDAVGELLPLMHPEGGDPRGVPLPSLDPPKGSDAGAIDESLLKQLEALGYID